MWAKNRWLLFLLSWIILASLITHKNDSLNSTIKLLSNDITWNHNIYMGHKCNRNCISFRSTGAAFLGTLCFFLSFLLLAIVHVLSVLFDEYGIWLFMSFVSTNFSYTSYWGRRGCDHMVVGFTTICAISVLSSLKLWVRTQFMANMYLIQHYVIEFVSDLRQVCSEKIRFPQPIKLPTMIKLKHVCKWC